MRAKRSKKYRKIMSTYNLHFSFRTPYQILCDSNFLRTCYAFHMPIQKFLENTLHGDSRPYLTQCTLARVVADHKKKYATKSADQAGQKGRGDGKPEWLPLPEVVPLRYCKHKDDDGKERGVISEEECLVDLISGQVRGNEVPKNKNHYVLATAESEEEQRQQQQLQKNGTPIKRKRGPDVREQVRLVPGVPIVYVKRSVMILEEVSVSSERVIRGVEKDKFKEGLVGAARNLKRKREDGGSESESEDENGDRQGGPKIRGLGKAKGPNPLSVMKKKLAKTNDQQRKQDQAQDTETTSKKPKRRKRGKKGGAGKENDASAKEPAPSEGNEVAVGS